ncbi:MAG: L-cystine transporter [Bacilli bacterium]
MDTLFILANIALMLVMVGVLYRMQKKYVSFSKRVFAGLGMGIAFGFLLQIAFGSDSEIVKTSADWFGIIGGGYVRLLKMIVTPLILVSIIGAITKLESGKGLGKMSAMIIGVLVFTTLISAGVGIVAANVFDLNAESITVGEAEANRGEMLEDKVDEANTTIPQKILEFIPTNPFQDMTGARSTSTLGVVIFAAFVGVAVLGIRKKKPAQAEMFKQMVDACYAVVMRIVTLILRLTPFGVLALMTNTIAMTNVDGIINLSTFVIASYAAIIAMFIIHGIILAFTGLNPITFFKKALPTLSFAFTSRTSAGAIPLNIGTQTKKLGISEGVANFAASFGASIGQNGCAGIYPAMLAVMIAPTVGINPMDPAFIVQLVVIVAISSFGVAGVGGGATFAALIVLSAMNLPVGLAGLLISIEPLIDMGRTALNVSGSMTAGAVTGKLLGEIDMNTYNNPNIEDDNDDTDGVA